MAKGPAETLELRYVDAPALRLSFATGVILSRLPGDLFQLAFYADTQSIGPETLVLAGPAGEGAAMYKNSSGSPEAIPFREVQARVLLGAETIRQLAEIIRQQTTAKANDNG